MCILLHIGQFLVIEQQPRCLCLVITVLSGGRGAAWEGGVGSSYITKPTNKFPPLERKSITSSNVILPLFYYRRCLPLATFYFNHSCWGLNEGGGVVLWCRLSSTPIRIWFLFSVVIIRGGKEMGANFKRREPRNFRRNFPGRARGRGEGKIESGLRTRVQTGDGRWSSAASRRWERDAVEE